MSNSPYLKELEKQHSPTVISLQETWTYSYHNNHKSIPAAYESQFKSIDDEDPAPQTHLTRPHAGTANLWRWGNTTPLPDGNHRVAVIENAKTGMVILNAYLPPRGSYSNDDFRQEVDQLHEICSKYQGRPIILAGDLNIDINKPHDSRTKYLVNFMKTHSLREPVPITEPTFHHNNGMGSSSTQKYQPEH